MWNRMNSVAGICLLVATLVLAEAARIRREDKYTTKYDNINIDDILQSDRLVQNYLNCFLDKGRCTPEAEEVKKNLPDAMQTECSKCSEKQKEIGEKVLKFLIDNKPDQWKLLEEKYDPGGQYKKLYKEKAEKWKDVIEKHDPEGEYRRKYEQIEKTGR